MRCSKAHSLFAADRLSVQLSQVTELSQVEMSEIFREFSEKARTSSLFKVSLLALSNLRMLRHYAKQAFTHGESTRNWDVCPCSASLQIL